MEFDSIDLDLSAIVTSADLSAARNVNAEDVKASYQDGILKLTVPKKVVAVFKIEIGH